MGLHAVQSLRQLSNSVQIGLTVVTFGEDDTLAVLLQQLHGVQLHELEVVAKLFSRTEEALLADCSVAHLTLRFLLPLLKMLLPNCSEYA